MTGWVHVLMDRPTVWPDVTQHSQALSLSNLTNLLGQNEAIGQSVQEYRLQQAADCQPTIW